MAVKLQFELCYYFPKMFLSSLNEERPFGLGWIFCRIICCGRRVMLSHWVKIIGISHAAIYDVGRAMALVLFSVGG